MNAAFLLSVSMFLFLQLGGASPVAFHQMTKRQESQTNDQELFDNYIDENESPELVPRSTKCAYYNKNDECHKSNDGCGQQYITCTKHQTRCYTMLNGPEIELQGCWTPSSPVCKVSQAQCLAQQLAFRSKHPLYFCCCSGDNCNEQYGLANDIPMRQ